MEVIFYDNKRYTTTAPMLRMIGYGENIGSGFPKILNAWKKAGWTEPVLENNFELQEVKLKLYIPKHDDHVNDHVKVTERLTERQYAILDLIKNDSTISLDQMTAKIGVSKRTIQRDIAAMKDIVKHVDSDKAGHWEIRSSK